MNTLRTVSTKGGGSSWGRGNTGATILSRDSTMLNMSYIQDNHKAIATVPVSVQAAKFMVLQSTDNANAALSTII